MSHPSRVRELKLFRAETSISRRKSHPSRVRELKQVFNADGVISSYVAPLPGA